MGTYTELVLKCDIKEDKPKIVHEALNFLFNKNQLRPDELPDHPFFKKMTWDCIGRCSSFYHCPGTLNFYDGRYLFSRSDLKNYDDEIQLFLDWLIPYLSASPGKFIGWIFLEGEKEPEFIYMPGEWE